MSPHQSCINQLSCHFRDFESKANHLGDSGGTPVKTRRHSWRQQIFLRVATPQKGCDSPGRFEGKAHPHRRTAGSGTSSACDKGTSVDEELKWDFQPQSSPGFKAPWGRSSNDNTSRYFRRIPSSTETPRRTRQLAAPCVKNATSASCCDHSPPCPCGRRGAQPDTPTLLPFSPCSQACLCPSLQSNCRLSCHLSAVLEMPRSRCSGHTCALGAGGCGHSVWCQGRTGLCPLVFSVPLKKQRIC